MKTRKLIAILLSIIASSILLISCQKQDSNNDNINELSLYNYNEILPKIDCITKIKKLLDCTYVYFFDCDFSDFKDITITDISYNISTSGYIIKNKRNNEILDLNEEADIKFVTNYQIATKSNCFGFSVISNVMKSKAYISAPGTTTTKTPNQIYDQFTYKSIDDITVDQIKTFGNKDNIITKPIKTPENFYPCELIPSAASQVKAFTGNSIDEEPILIITHYEDEDKKPDNETFIKSIAYYFKDNGKYTQH